eukprot:scaffold7639_cov258-Pinguiococcus_pyrenoidosus.AAC.5
MASVSDTGDILEGTFWTVDPIDGVRSAKETSNFASGGNDWAVALSYVEDYEPVVAVVHLPGRGETLAAVKGQGLESTTADGMEFIRSQGVIPAFGLSRTRRYGRTRVAGETAALHRLQPRTSQCVQVGGSSADTACGGILTKRSALSLSLSLSLSQAQRATRVTLCMVSMAGLDLGFCANEPVCQGIRRLRLRS